MTCTKCGGPLARPGSVGTWCPACLAPLIEEARERVSVTVWKIQEPCVQGQTHPWVGIILAQHPETGEALRWDTVRKTRQEAEYYPLARVVRWESKAGVKVVLRAPVKPVLDRSMVAGS